MTRGLRSRVRYRGGGGGGSLPPKSDPQAVLAYLQEYAPPVYDPFCGGGSIPLEAQRLGLRAYGSDLNPVAVLISKALVEIPPKFAGLPPVNPDRDPHKRWTGAKGLAEDVRHYGQWMRAEAERRIGRLYPQVAVTDATVREQPRLAELKGRNLTVIAWIWARTVASPNPAAKGAQVPLVSSFMLTTTKGRKAWVEPVIDARARDGYRFTVRSDDIAEEDEAKAKAGTVGQKMRGGQCLLTGAAMPFPYLREQGKSVGLGQRLMAIVAEGPRGRVYLSPSAEHERIAASAAPEWEPEGDLPDNPRDFATTNYGMPRFADLFTPRQLVALTTFSDLVSEARGKVLTDARASGLTEGPRLAEGGGGAEAYADAVATYLTFANSRNANRGSVLCTWINAPNNEKLSHTFVRQAISMIWDFAEGNPFSSSSGNFVSNVEWVAKAIEQVPALPGGVITAVDAQQNNYPVQPTLISTDPPYYDNVAYADLSDFFYVWLRRALQTVWPRLFTTLLVPKAEELVAARHRHDDKKQAEQFFEHGMGLALKAMQEAADPSGPLTIYYAFKQSERTQEGTTSTGWATFLQGVMAAELTVDGTLPIRTERPNRMIALDANALASSIVLVCRRRPDSARTATRAEFLNALRRELPQALRHLQQGNIAPVDMAQASIGPGMAVFSRYARVLEADDSSMRVQTALQLINAALDEYLSEQAAEYDPETRFAITWFETHAMGTAASGQAETLATARNVSVDGVAAAGLIESRGSKVRLLSRSEIPGDWDPETDSRPTVWEATQHLIRRLEEEGEQAAAELLRLLAGRAEPARDLAYRLYQICERNNWAEEARAYNGLVIAWPELTKLARQTPETALL